MNVTVNTKATITGITIVVINSKEKVSIHERTQFLMEKLGIGAAMAHDNLYCDIVGWVNALMLAHGERRMKGLRLFSQKVEALRWRIQQIARRDARRQAAADKAAREAHEAAKAARDEEVRQAYLTAKHEQEAAKAKETAQMLAEMQKQQEEALRENAAAVAATPKPKAKRVRKPRATKAAPLSDKVIRETEVRI